MDLQEQTSVAGALFGPAGALFGALFICLFGPAGALFGPAGAKVCSCSTRSLVRVSCNVIHLAHVDACTKHTHSNHNIDRYRQKLSRRFRCQMQMPHTTTKSIVIVEN